MRPGPLRIAYSLAVYSLAVACVAGGYGVMAAYTTSQNWAGALALGVMVFDTKAAANLGQARAFVLDLRRLAYLPLTPAWFPRVGEMGPACWAVRRRRCGIG